MKKEVDWYIHFIPCERPSFHTHGLDRYGSLELELALPVDPKAGMQLINHIAAQIAWHGKHYQNGDKVSDVLALPFYLFRTAPIQPSKPNDEVLRILLCDKHHRYPWDEGCDTEIREQLSEEERKRFRALREWKRGNLWIKNE